MYSSTMCYYQLCNSQLICDSIWLTYTLHFFESLGPRVSPKLLLCPIVTLFIGELWCSVWYENVSTEDVWIWNMKDVCLQYPSFERCTWYFLTNTFSSNRCPATFMSSLMFGDNVLCRICPQSASSFLFFYI